MSGTVRIAGKIDVAIFTRPLTESPTEALGAGEGEAEIAGTDPPGRLDLPDRSPVAPRPTLYFSHPLLALAILAPPCRRFCVVSASLTGPGSGSVRSAGNVFSGAGPSY